MRSCWSSTWPAWPQSRRRPPPRLPPPAHGTTRPRSLGKVQPGPFHKSVILTIRRLMLTLHEHTRWLGEVRKQSDCTSCARLCA